MGSVLTVDPPEYDTFLIYTIFYGKIVLIELFAFYFWKWNNMIARFHTPRHAIILPIPIFFPPKLGSREWITSPESYEWS